MLPETIYSWIPFPLEKTEMTVQVQKTKELLKEELESNQYDIIIGFSQGAIMTNLLLEWIKNKEIVCKMPKLVIICACSFDISIFSTTKFDCKSIHMIGEKDPAFEICKKNI
jgi:hypothetical protein